MSPQMAVRRRCKFCSKYDSSQSPNKLRGNHGGDCLFLFPGADCIVSLKTQVCSFVPSAVSVPACFLSAGLQRVVTHCIKSCAEPTSFSIAPMHIHAQIVFFFFSFCFLSCTRHAMVTNLPLTSLRVQGRHQITPTFDCMSSGIRCCVEIARYGNLSLSLSSFPSFFFPKPRQTPVSDRWSWFSTVPVCNTHWQCQDERNGILCKLLVSCESH